MIKMVLPDVKNTFAVFKVSDRDTLELPVVCWAVVESDYANPPIDTVGMVIQEGEPSLITVDRHELLFLGYVHHKEG